MEPKQFNKLALTALVSLIAAGLVHSAYNDFSDVSSAGQKLFPELAGSADNVGQIAIAQDDKTITLNKSEEGKGWAVAERNGFPADFSKVLKLVRGLAKAELVEAKTRDEKRYSQLELEDPKAKNAKSKLIQLNDNSGSKIGQLVLGKKRFGAFRADKAGTYVRKPSDAQTWLVNADVEAPVEIRDWVDPVFFRIDRNEIKSIVVREGKKTNFKLAPDEKKNGIFQISDAPTGRKVKADFRPDEVINGIRTLELIDVRLSKEADASPDMVAEIEMKDGTRYTVGLKREDKKRWVTVKKFAAQAKEPSKKAEAAGQAVKSKADTKDKPDAAGADAKGKTGPKKMASSIRAAQTGKWSFEVAGWRAGQVFKAPGDVFEALKPTPKTEAGPKKEGAAPAMPAPTNGNKVGN